MALVLFYTIFPCPIFPTHPYESAVCLQWTHIAYGSCPIWEAPPADQIPQPHDHGLLSIPSCLPSCLSDYFWILCYHNPEPPPQPPPRPIIPWACSSLCFCWGKMPNPKGPVFLCWLQWLLPDKILFLVTTSNTSSSSSQAPRPQKITWPSKDDYLSSYLYGKIKTMP